MISSSIKALVLEPEAHRADHLLALMGESIKPFIEAEIVDSLSAGLKRFSEGAWDVVVTRLRLPDAKGLEALVRFHLVSREVPVIVILEDEEQEVVLEAAQSLAEDCLFWNDLDGSSFCQSVMYSIDRREMLHELHNRQNAQSASLNKTPYKALLNRIDEALFLISLEEGSLLFANDVAKAWFDKDIDEMVKDLLEYRILDGEEIEMEITTRTPTIPNAELRSVCMEWRGRPTCMVTLRNISKRKRAEEAFMASQRRLELALKASNIGLWSWELRSNQIRFTERWKALLGYSSFEFPDTLAAFRDHIHPEDRERVINRFKKFLRQPWPDFECEYRLRHKDGEYRDVICRAEIFADKDGKLSKMVGSQIDITERKRLEQARLDFEKQLRDTQRFESLGVMAGGVAHSLNNLLTSIMGNASLLLADLPEGAEGVRRIQKMEQCAEHAKELCQKMLSFSGKGNIVVQPVELNAIALECKELIEISLPREARSSFDLKEGLSKLEADPSEIQQLVLNLAMNAAEALNGKEWGRLAVRSGEVELDQKSLSRMSNGQNASVGRFVYLEVEDDGHGMSSDVLERVFDPFYTTKFKGRGLGLSAVQGIANAHDGAIEISSALGKGTRIRVYLPALVEKSEKSICKGDCGCKKVLIAEDEDVLRMVVSSMVASYGYEVLEAVDGSEAWEMYQENKDELVLAMVDLNMPRMDGGRLFKKIREENEYLPIVLMSGDDDEVTMPFEDCARERCHFMHKPFGMEQLKQSFRVLLNRREAGVAALV